MLQAVTKLLIVPTVLLARTPPLPQVSALRVLLALPTLMPMQPHHAKTVWRALIQKPERLSALRVLMAHESGKHPQLDRLMPSIDPCLPMLRQQRTSSPTCPQQLLAWTAILADGFPSSSLPTSDGSLFFVMQLTTAVVPKFGAMLEST